MQSHNRTHAATRIMWMNDLHLNFLKEDEFSLIYEFLGGRKDNYIYIK